MAALSLHLTQIRKPYLSLSDPPLSRRRRDDHHSGLNRSNGTLDEDGSIIENGVDGEDAGFKRWEGSKYLSDREREEIDLNGKLILRRCKERVGILEDAEKGIFVFFVFLISPSFLVIALLFVCSSSLLVPLLLTLPTPSTSPWLPAPFKLLSHSFLYPYGDSISANTSLQRHV